MAVKARDDVTLASVVDVSDVRRYYLLQASTLAAPSAPTANPAPSPWTTSEPAYDGTTTSTLYTVTITVFTDGTFDYSTVSKASSYEAAKAAYNKAASALTVANLATDMAKGLVTVSTTAPDVTQVGRVWIIPSADGTHVSGMKISNGSAWTSYAMMVEDLMVVGDAGTVQLKNGSVDTPNLTATAIDTMTITGSTFQTSADEHTGIKATPLGIIAYDAAGNPTVSIGVDGTLTLGADVVDGSAIADGTVPGSALDTADVVDTLTQSTLATQLDMSTNASVSNAIGNAVTPVSAQAQATAKGLAQQQAYFRFAPDTYGQPVVTLGASNSPNQLRLTNTEVDLLQGGYIVSRWTAGRMEVSQMKVTSIIIGNHQLESLGNGQTVVRAV